jgi:hypothetical protein
MGLCTCADKQDKQDAHAANNATFVNIKISGKKKGILEK